MAAGDGPATRILRPDDETDLRGSRAEAATAGAIDGRMVRSALAATVLGALAEETRPSRLLGEGGASSLIGTTLDGLWGLGQQAALGFIVTGKTPRRQQIGQDGMRIIAASANRKVANLVEGATQYGEDNGIRFLRNLEVTAAWYPGERPSLEARTIDALFQSAALDHTLFLQADLRTNFSDATANIGLGYRYVVPDSAWMLGINAFYDHAFPIGHDRISIGVEATHGDFTLFGNRYIALSGWTEKNARYDERPLSGWDAGIAGPLPRVEDLTVSLAAFRWERETGTDKTGLRLTADYEVTPAFGLGATLSADNAGDVRAGLRLTYQFGAGLPDGDQALLPSVRDHRLDFVNRENRILTEKREVPKDYAIQFLSPEVNAANQSSLSFVITGSPPASRYSYRITSSGGGLPVTGTGPVDSDPQQVTGVDVSQLPDGTLTLSITVISKEGAVGPAVRAEIVKATESLGVTTSTETASPTNASPIGFTIRFSQAVTGFGLADIALSNGTAGNLHTSDNVTWLVDVMPTGPGAVELQVPAGAAQGSTGTANTASNTTRVSYDNAPPAGYSVAFLASPLASTTFAISGAEAGSTYRFTISSTGGGTPVTGTGAVTAATQQVTGIDLSGLADGTLTLSLTLTDALGNAGAPATTTMMKDANPLVIVAIAPPAPGDFDDL